MDAPEAVFTLRDLHEESAQSVKAIVGSLGLEDSAADILIADVLTCPRSLPLEGAAQACEAFQASDILGDAPRLRFQRLAAQEDGDERAGDQAS